MKKKARRRQSPRAGRPMRAPDPDNLPPELAKLKTGELINTVPQYQEALAAAPTEFSETAEASGILAARTACQEIQIIIGRLLKLNRVEVNKLLNRSRSKRRKNRGVDLSGGGSVWVVGQGQCRKQGSH